VVDFVVSQGRFGFEHFGAVRVRAFDQKRIGNDVSNFIVLVQFP